MREQSRLFVVSGPSGSGKTSVMREALSNEIISVTTRDIRPGEVDGRDYYFVTDDEFEKLYAEGQLVESSSYYGSASYGVTRDELMKKLSLGDAFIIVDVEGFKQLKLYSNSRPYLRDNIISIFMYTTKDEARGRMKKRGDSDEKIAKRLSTFDKEMNNFYMYNYLVENRDGNFEEAVESIRFIVEGDAQ